MQCALKAARHNSLVTWSYLQLRAGSPREVSLPALSLDHPLLLPWFYLRYACTIQAGSQKPDFGISQNALTFYVSNINTNNCYKRSFAQISLLLIVLDMAFLYSKIQGEYFKNRLWAITFDWNVVQTSSLHHWTTFWKFFSGIPHLPTFCCTWYLAPGARY